MTRGLLAALALPVLIAGCASQAAPSRGVKGGDGILRLSFVGEPRSLNPNLGPDEAALLVTQNLFNRLVSLSADGDIIPDLAESWEESDDGLTYTFHLRAGVRWHDGRPLTAGDVRATLLRVATESANRDVGARIEDVTTPDPRTIVVRLREPWAAFLAAFAWYGTSILPAHVYGTSPWDGHPASERPVGTGPFRFKTWERGSRLVLEKNVDYFGPGPYVDAVEYTFVNSPSAVVDMLLEGRADLLLGRPPTERLPDLLNATQIQVSTSPTDGRTYLALNFRRKPFDDLTVRRAIGMAIDRRAIVDDVLGGLGTPATGFYTPSVEWAYNPEARAPGHNRHAAAAALSASVPRGLQATLVCLLAGPGERLGEHIARQLTAAGLRVRAECLLPQEYIDRVYVRRDFDLAILSGSQGPDPDNLRTRFASNGAGQVAGYANPELDALLARGARTSDTAVRVTVYRRAQEILARDLPVVPLVENVRVAVYRSGLRGLPQEDARGLVPGFTYNLVRLPRSR